MALAAEGAKVVTNNRSAGTPGGDAGTVAEEIVKSGGKAVPFYGDVAGFETARQLIEKAEGEFGRIDILINNAGTANMSVKCWEMTEKDWDECLDSHLKGSFNCIRHASALMKEQGWGRIINTTSVAWLGFPAHANYGAAKAGIVGLTRAVARELGGCGITCNAYGPAAGTRATFTDGIQTKLKQTYEDGFITREQYEAMVNPPKPETVGPMMVYLCTDEAADVNGQIFDVFGGEISIFSEPVKAFTITKEEGQWTVAELLEQVPAVLLQGYRNPAPPQP
jgi:3-oxoacyl-[acyl-carrier protein] reductase